MSTVSNKGVRGTSYSGKRTRLVRAYPIHSLEDALTVAAAIQESSVGLPFERVLLAGALNTTPASSGFTLRLNSSAKYGLTQGGYNDDLISLTPLGQAIVSPQGQDELSAALVEAATRPDVFGGFYRIVDGKRLPEDTYAQNMLHREMGVQPELTAECLSIIKANGLHVGILKQTDGAITVELKAVQEMASGADVASVSSAKTPAEIASHGERLPVGRIFVRDGDGTESAQMVREVLDEFEIPYAIAEEDELDLQPVPARVSTEMRNCSAAILIFNDSTKRSAERMLYQLGAASVLYGDKMVIIKDTRSKQTLEVAGLRIVEFDSKNPEASGLQLLQELRRAGVIRVVA